MSSITLLQAVNRVGRRVGFIIGDAGELSSFTDTGRQQDIDACLDAINDVIDQIYIVCNMARGSVGQDSFTLVASQRNYATPSDFVQMELSPIDATNNNVLEPYPGGFEQFRLDYNDPTDYTGRPRHWYINPETQDLEIDTTPTSAEAGESYTYYYRKSLDLTSIADTFPFPDEVTRTLYDAFAQKWLAERQASLFNEALLLSSLARAADMLRDGPKATRYGTRRVA